MSDLGMVPSFSNISHELMKTSLYFQSIYNIYFTSFSHWAKQKRIIPISKNWNSQKANQSKTEVIYYLEARMSVCLPNLP